MPYVSNLGSCWRSMGAPCWQLMVTYYDITPVQALSSHWPVQYLINQIGLEAWLSCTNFILNGSPSFYWTLNGDLQQLWHHKKIEDGAPMRYCLQWVWVAITQEPLSISLQVRFILNLETSPSIRLGNDFWVYHPIKNLHHKSNLQID